MTQTPSSGIAPRARAATNKSMNPKTNQNSTSGAVAQEQLVRRFPARRVFRITCAPEARPPTADEIRSLLWNARTDSEWAVQECVEEAELMPPIRHLISAEYRKMEQAFIDAKMTKSAEMAAKMAESNGGGLRHAGE